MSGENEDELGAAFSDRRFDVFPEILTPKEFCQIAPNRISFLCQPQSEPSRKLIVLWGCMTDEDHISLDVAVLIHTEGRSIERDPVDGWRERADENLDGAVHKAVAYHKEGQELRKHLVRLWPA